MENHIISFSGGKDSTAMLLMMLEKQYPVTHILFCDTGKEFDELYAHVQKVDDYIHERYGLNITRLQAEHSYEYYQTYIPIKRNPGATGYGWSSPQMRWCCKQFKERPITHFLKTLQGTIHQYIGIASDEPKRLRQRKNTRYPLAEWGVTENECLEYCYQKGFNFGGLYKKFKRLGCFCCPLSSINDLYALYKHYPKKWQELQAMEDEMIKNIRRTNKITYRPFKQPSTTVKDLTKRFAKRAKQEEVQSKLFL